MPQPQKNIVDYGAKGDGKTINTSAIQQAIDQTNASGGGTVYIPSGVFLSGTLRLRSNITLYLEAGAVLKGSPNTADYPEGMGLIFGEDLINIAFTGDGEINGNGSSFMNPGTLHSFIDYDKDKLRQGEDYLSGITGAGDGPVSYTERPDIMIFLMHCENVKMEGIRLVDSPHWSTRFANCENVLVKGISLLNNQMVPNSDGLHFTTSRNVRVADCHIVAGDDALIVTGFGEDFAVNNKRTYQAKENYQYGNQSGVAEHMVVSNCILSSRSAGIRIGYGDNDMRNLFFQNIIIRDSNRGVGVFSRDKGSIENVSFSNFIVETSLFKGTWWGRGEPIHVSAITRNKDKESGTVSDITFKDFKIKSETGIVVYGARQGLVKNIKFEDINLLIASGKNAEDGGNIDLRPTASLETNLFERDLPAFYINNAESIELKDIKIDWSNNIASYFTHGIEAESFSDLLIDGFQGKPAGSNNSAIFLQNGSQVTIRNAAESVKEEGTDNFLEMINVEEIETSNY